MIAIPGQRPYKWRMSDFRSGGQYPSAAPRESGKKGGSGVLRAARAADLAVIEGMLASSGLPVEGVREGPGYFFVYVDDGGTLLGAVGLELYGTAGLLRSTAVVACARRRGIAAALIERVVARARERGCQALYLLTLDAERYFQRFGFTAIGRDEAPEVIQASPEFTTLCPLSAVLMRKLLEA